MDEPAVSEKASIDMDEEKTCIDMDEEKTCIDMDEDKTCIDMNEPVEKTQREMEDEIKRKKERQVNF